MWEGCDGRPLLPSADDLGSVPLVLFLVLGDCAMNSLDSLIPEAEYPGRPATALPADTPARVEAEMTSDFPSPSLELEGCEARDC